MDSSPIFDEEPMVVLRVPHSQRSSQALNAITKSQGQGLMVIRGSNSNQSSKPKQVTSKNVTIKSAVNPEMSYNLVDQLQRTPDQISIFELLEFSPRHKHVLKDALCTANVPNNIDVDQFQNMVNHLASPHYLTFSEEDDKALSHPHNLPFILKS